jgi:YrbI family 3-deoxy-D-manno-octulosonate 8-phosphate phosphatase
MSVVAIIPARGGSKQVPRKNVLAVGGVPLIQRAVSTALCSDLIDLVVVSTDDLEIANLARAAGARVVDRPASLSGDSASSETAIMHALDAVADDATVVVFLQATSPFIDAPALDRAIERVLSGREDVVFSAVETYAFLWEPTKAGAVGVNHDHRSRPRRQDRDPHYQETGAFYVMDVAGFKQSTHRFFGRVGFEITPESGSVEIDSMEQLVFAQALAPLLDRACDIDVDAVVTDFDGVHTADTATISADGDERVTVSRSDGMGVRLLREAEVPVLILSTEQHPVVAARAAKLRVDVRHGVADKAAALIEWADSKGIPLERIAYVGNDINDLSCLAIVGWPIAVPGAHESVLSAARVVLDHEGGSGAVRELAERVLRARTQSFPTEKATAWLTSQEPLSATDHRPTSSRRSDSITTVM